MYWLALSGFARAYEGTYFQDDMDPNTFVIPFVDFDDLHEFNLPVIRDTLPAPLLHAEASDVHTPSLRVVLDDAPGDLTVSAWVQVADGKVLELVGNHTAELWGQFQFGVGSTSYFGETGASLFGVAPDELPPYFLFLTQPSISSTEYFSTVLAMNLPIETWNGAEWLHVAAAKGLFGTWIAYSGDAFIPFLAPGALNRVFGFGTQITADSPLAVDATFGGHAGAIALYPDLLAPPLIMELNSVNPFATPEPTAMVSILVATGVIFARGRGRRLTTSHCPRRYL